MKTFEELDNSLKVRQKLYARVFAGKNVICPICGKGYLHAAGRSFISCDQPGCRMKVDFYPAPSHLDKLKESK